MKELLNDNMEIWKFQLDNKKETEVEAPEVILPLTAQVQGSTVCVWAIVDPAKPKIKKKFMIIATGEPFNPTGKHHIGSVQRNGFVWHIFSCSNNEP